MPQPKPKQKPKHYNPYCPYWYDDYIYDDYYDWDDDYYYYMANRMSNNPMPKPPTPPTPPYTKNNVVTPDSYRQGFTDGFAAGVKWAMSAGELPPPAPTPVPSPQETTPTKE